MVELSTSDEPRRDLTANPVASAVADTIVASDALLNTLLTPPPFAGIAEHDAGARIGRYFVIRKLGAGAMGVVYAAYDPKLDRKVALKLLAGLAEGTADARQRLQREAQALAKLAHPNVVGVYDVDMYDRQLYVAMEFIAGRTLSTWMHEEPRSWRVVLNVFIEAGRGLAAAHAAGLVHRDFKPENAMVGEDGRVRVMDFGLARPIDALPKLEELRASLSEKLGPRALESPMTFTGMLMGTPAYMPLEQFEGKANSRSDQFSFCVALYEGLYGERPFAADSLARLLGALSSGVVKSAPRGATVPTWLRSVVLRGLAPEPEKRWPSMDALLAALADDPARRRRRWTVMALGATLGLGIAGGTVRYAERQNQACIGFEAKLVSVWDEPTSSRAQAAFAETGVAYAAHSWRGTSERLNSYTQRWVAARREACEATQRGEQSGELLDLRMACLDERLRHVKATVKIFAAADEDVVRKAVETVASLPRLERCADLDALAAEQPPPEDPAVAVRVARLDEQRIEAKALWYAGKYDRGLEVATAAVKEAAELGYEPLQARAWVVQAALLNEKGAYAEAEARLEDAYASALGLRMMTEASEAAADLVFLVGVRQVRFEDGRQWGKHAEPLARAVGDAEAQGRLLGILGAMAYTEGKFTEARAYHERALAIVEALDPDYIAAPLINLGLVSKGEGKLDRAHAYYAHASAILEKAVGPDHPEFAHLLIIQGDLAQEEKELDQARAYFLRASAIMEAALGTDHPDLAAISNNLGVVAQKQGKLGEAYGHHERALSNFERTLGPDHPNLAVVLNNLGGIALKEGKLDQASSHLERALAIREKALGPGHPRVAEPLNGLGEVMQKQGELDAARTYYERALAISAKALGPDHPDLAYAFTNLGDVARKEGKLDEARSDYEHALAIWEAALGPDHPNLAYPLTGLGKALLAFKTPADSLPPLERALSIRNSHQGDPVELAETRFILARALWDADAGRARTRARELAELAAEAYATVGERATTELAEVRAWQSTHKP